MKLTKLLASMTLVASAISLPAMAAVDADIPAYTKSSGVSGNVSSVGSDTLANMMPVWAE
jgi:phosphate transport system substrate-binding protein